MGKRNKEQKEKKKIPSPLFGFSITTSSSGDSEQLFGAISVKVQHKVNTEL